MLRGGCALNPFGNTPFVMMHNGPSMSALSSLGIGLHRDNPYRLAVNDHTLLLPSRIQGKYEAVCGRMPVLMRMLREKDAATTVSQFLDTPQRPSVSGLPSYLKNGAWVAAARLLMKPTLMQSDFLDIALSQEQPSLLLVGNAGTGKLTAQYRFAHALAAQGKNVMILSANAARKAMAATTMSAYQLHAVSPTHAYPLWQNTDALVIDGWAFRDGIEELDHLGRLYRMTDRPFGGVQVVASSDAFIPRSAFNLYLRIPSHKFGVVYWEHKEYHRNDAIRGLLRYVCGWSRGLPRVYPRKSTSSATVRVFPYVQEAIEHNNAELAKLIAEGKPCMSFPSRQISTEAVGTQSDFLLVQSTQSTTSLDALRHSVSEWILFHCSGIRPEALACYFAPEGAGGSDGGLSAVLALSCLEDEVPDANAAIASLHDSIDQVTDGQWTPVKIQSNLTWDISPSNQILDELKLAEGSRVRLSNAASLSDPTLRVGMFGTVTGFGKLHDHIGANSHAGLSQAVHRYISDLPEFFVPKVVFDNNAKKEVVVLPTVMKREDSLRMFQHSFVGVPLQLAFAAGVTSCISTPFSHTTLALNPQAFKDDLMAYLPQLIAACRTEKNIQLLEPLPQYDTVKATWKSIRAAHPNKVFKDSIALRSRASDPIFPYHQEGFLDDDAEETQPSTT